MDCSERFIFFISSTVVQKTSPSSEDFISPENLYYDSEDYYYPSILDEDDIPEDEILRDLDEE